MGKVNTVKNGVGRPAARGRVTPGAALVGEMVDVGSLHLDPSNVRTHPEKNLAAIKASLKRFGQQKAILVDGAGVVIAGNGTLMAARELGWRRVLVARSNLAGAERTAYAIADNRTAELAAWDGEALSAQLESFEADVRQATGFDDGDLAEALAKADGADGKGAGSGAGGGFFEVVVECKDERDQQKVYQRLRKEGRVCRFNE